MTTKELKAELAAWREKALGAATPYVKSRKWEFIVIAALLACALFAFWRWQVHASEAERLGNLVKIGTNIEESQARLDALDREANERRAQIKAKLEQLADADKRLLEKRDALKKASAARVSAIPKDAQGVAKALTDAGFPASAVMK